jgi:hypothetical protein
MDQMMELAFARSDIIQVGPQLRKTTHVLSKGKSNTQKIVSGLTGILIYLLIRN